MDDEVAVPTCPDCDQCICPGCVAHKALETLRTEQFDVPNITGFDLTNIRRVINAADAFEDVRVAKLAATLTMLSRGRWECCAKHSVQESRGWHAYEASATASLKRLAKLRW